MKLVCFDRNSFILLALILRQFGLSVPRGGPKTEKVTLFLEENYPFYDLLKEKLIQIMDKYDLDIVLNGVFTEKFPTGIGNFFLKKTCFFESDFRHIIKFYFSICQIIKAGNIEFDDKWITIGKEAWTYSMYLMYRKLSKKERMIVNRIEHFGQNELVYDKYYTIEEALTILSMRGTKQSH